MGDNRNQQPKELRSEKPNEPPYVLLPQPLIQSHTLAAKHQQLLYRLHAKGKVMRLQSGVYIRKEKWEKLTPTGKAIAQGAAANGSARLRQSRPLAGKSAAVVYGMPVAGRRPTSHAEVLATRSSKSTTLIPRPLTPGGSIRQVPTAYGPLPATDPLTTVLDLALWNGLEDCVVAGDWCVSNGVFTKEDFRERVEAARGVRNLSVARTACRMINGLSESPRESQWKVRMFEAGLPAPFQQVNIYDEDGRFLARVDFFWPNGLVGEYDGREKYGRQDPEKFAYVVEGERERERELLAEGCVVVRADWVSFEDGSALRRLMRMQEHLERRGHRFPEAQFAGGGVAWQ